jgi:hypothetical protein
MIIGGIRGLLVAATVLGFAAGAGADDCKTLTQTAKDMIDKVDDTSARSDAGRCAIFADGLGMMKLFRVLRDSCLEEGSTRIAELTDLDRGIRRLQGQIDSKCR